jgi:hypothetical protein
MLPDTAFLVAGLFPYLQVVFHNFPLWLCTTANTTTVPKLHEPHQQFESSGQCGKPAILPQSMDGTSDWRLGRKSKS